MTNLRELAERVARPAKYWRPGTPFHVIRDYDQRREDEEMLQAKAAALRAIHEQGG